MWRSTSWALKRSVIVGSSSASASSSSASSPRRRSSSTASVIAAARLRLGSPLDGWRPLPEGREDPVVELGCPRAGARASPGPPSRRRPGRPSPTSPRASAKVSTAADGHVAARRPAAPGRRRRPARRVGATPAGRAVSLATPRSKACAHQLGDAVLAHPLLVLAVLEHRAERGRHGRPRRGRCWPSTASAVAQSIVSATPGGL